MPYRLRWKLAVVTGAGAGLGREVSVGLARLGVRVVVVDRDAVAAEETAALVRAERVQAWPVQADLADEADVRLVAARARDLGTADVLVHAGADAPPLLTRLFLDALPAADGEREVAPAVVHVGAAPGRPAEEVRADLRHRARVMAVVARPEDPVPTHRVVRAVVDLATVGRAGEVVEPVR